MWMGVVVIYLIYIFKESLSDQVTFERRIKESERMSHVTTWGNSIPDRDKSKRNRNELIQGMTTQPMRLERSTQKGSDKAFETTVRTLDVTLNKTIVEF